MLKAKPENMEVRTRMLGTNNREDMSEDMIVDKVRSRNTPAAA